MSAATSPAGATPLQAREYQRQAQRCVRLALNAVNKGSDQWKAASTSGRSAASALVNAILEERDLPNRQLGSFQSVPGIVAAALLKLKDAQQGHYTDLCKESASLRAALEMVRSAADSVQQLLLEHAGAPGNPTHSTSVFHCLPLTTLGNLFGSAVQMMEAEITVKETVVCGLRDAMSGESDSQKSQRDRMKPNGCGSLRAVLQVHSTEERHHEPLLESL
mmetsp:Transcript_5761/g.16181  ORF Transcript_5761/g.16181 Transcript_5761/m.16181 type:complete len:220 (-) Transcript_5761:461-1120(-)